jgi:LacI family transcriptional regulator
MATTLADVARSAGVSSATVSRVLNDKLKMPIPEATVERIRRAARELNYTPNRMAQALATRRSHTLGFYSQEITDPHGGELLDTIQSEARLRGYQVLVASQLDTLSGAGQAEGIIAFRPTDEFVNRQHPEYPVVHVYPARETFPNGIGWSDFEGARDAARFLASLGHRKVAAIHGAGAPDKGAGFALGAAECGLELVEYREQDDPLDYGSQSEYISFFLGSGYRLTQQMLRERPETTAVFTRNDVLAAGVLQGLHAAGVSVPGQISVISYNDSLVAACASPPLTAIHTPVREAGSLAVERIIQAIEGRNPSFEGVLLPTSLVERSSTAPPPRQ